MCLGEAGEEERGRASREEREKGRDWMKAKRGGSAEEGEEKEILKREGKEGGRGRGCERETRGCEQTSRKMPCGCTSNPKCTLGAVASRTGTLTTHERQPANNDKNTFQTLQMN